MHVFVLTGSILKLIFLLYRALFGAVSKQYGTTGFDKRLEMWVFFNGRIFDIVFLPQKRVTD